MMMMEMKQMEGWWGRLRRTEEPGDEAHGEGRTPIGREITAVSLTAGEAEVMSVRGQKKKSEYTPAFLNLWFI